MFEQLIKLVLMPISLLISFIYKMLMALVKWFMFHFASSGSYITNDEMNMIYALCILFGVLGTMIIFKTGAYLRFTDVKRKIRKQRKETYWSNLEAKKRRFDALGKNCGFKTPSLDELDKQEMKNNPTVKQRFENDFFRY